MPVPANQEALKRSLSTTIGDVRTATKAVTESQAREIIERQDQADRPAQGDLTDEQIVRSIVEHVDNAERKQKRLDDAVRRALEKLAPARLDTLPRGEQ